MRNDSRPALGRYSVALASIAVGASACGSSSPTASSSSTTTSATKTTTNASTKAQAKKEVQTPNVSVTKLTGVDTQIAFSTSVGSAWAAKKVTLAAVAPGSTGTSNGEQTISLPISGGSFQYDKTDSAATGTIDTTGGLRLSSSGATALSVTDLEVNLKTKTIDGTVNGTSSVPLFLINGSPAASLQGSQTTLYGMTIQLSPQGSSQLKQLFAANKSLGSLTITTSTGK